MQFKRYDVFVPCSVLRNIERSLEIEPVSQPARQQQRARSERLRARNSVDQRTEICVLVLNVQIHAEIDIAERNRLITLEGLWFYGIYFVCGIEARFYRGKVKIIFTFIRRVRSHVAYLARGVVDRYVDVDRHVGQYALEPADETCRLNIETRSLKYGIEIDEVENACYTLQAAGVDLNGINGVRNVLLYRRRGEHIEKHRQQGLEFDTREIDAAEEIAQHLGNAHRRLHEVVHVEIFERDASQLGRPDVEHAVHDVYAHRGLARIVRKLERESVILIVRHFGF